MLHFPSPFSRLRVDQLLEPVDYVWSMTTHIPRGMVIGPPRGEKGEESIFFSVELFEIVGSSEHS